MDPIRVKVWKKGDFCPSPSLSEDFGRLLAIQVVDWIFELQKAGINNPLKTMDMGLWRSWERA